jgi:hypothetical protein
MKNKNRSVMLIVVMWIAVMVLFILATYLPKILATPYLKLIEVYSSWITAICTLVLGLLTAIMVAPYSVPKAVLVAFAYGSIFICYIGYVTIDYGASEPLMAAIGFNIATILQTFSIWKISQLLRK